MLDAVSLEVAGGRIVALAGPNGAGKTSLMRAIAGRLRLDTGSIAIDGRPVAEARTRGLLGLVPQDIALYPHLTVRENLAVLGRVAGLSGATLRRRVEEGLEWAGLTDRAGWPVRTLSGGMRRRVNLVAGVLHRPVLLLLDEPTVGVNAESESRLHGLLRTLRDEGMGVLVATHDLDDAAALCDDIVVLAGGQVRAAGPIPAMVAAAFKEGREIVVSVDAGSVESAAPALAGAGFRPSSPHTWTRPASEGMAALAEVEQRLRTSGVRIAELRVTEPSLRGAIARLTGAPGGEAQ